MQVDYPDSLPAVHDVRDCLAHAKLQQHLVGQLRAAIFKRLLHAGVYLWLYLSRGPWLQACNANVSAN
jgi:hypothetical protein